jgi:peptidoglycan/LPS O-acetylase OafA/YrhL
MFAESVTAESPSLEHPLSPSRRKANETSHLFELDVLRGFLSWWVVVDHAIVLAGFQEDDLPRIAKIILHGAYAVDIFIIMSGFVITKLLAEKKESYGRFIKRRFMRLFPVFFVATLIAIFIRLVLSSVLLANLNYSSLLWASEHKYFWTHILAHLSMLHGAIPDAILPYSSIAFLAPAWSISLEFQYYLVAPVFALMDRKYGARGRLALIAGSVFICHFFGSAMERWYGFPSFLPEKLPLFLAGMTSYWIYVEAHNKHKELSGRLLFAAVPLVYSLTNPLPLTIWIAGFALILGDIESRAIANVKNLLNRPSLRFLGKISYSTYLIHFPLIWLAKAFVVRIAPEISRQAMAVSLLVIVIPLTLISSAFLYRFIEKPGIDLGRRLTSR